MATPNVDKRPVEIAQELFAWGFNPLPAAYGSKVPSIPWKPYIDRRVTLDEIDRWFGHLKRSNYWTPTGLVSRVAVLDCDNTYTIGWWRERLGDVMDLTVSARTARGMHFFFRLDKPMKSWSRHEGDLQFDVRADGAGVILPPSVHHTGADYGWDRTPKS